MMCIACKSFSFKRVSPAEAKEGKGHCENRSHFIRHDAKQERDCGKFKQEAVSTVSARMEWLNAQV